MIIKKAEYLKDYKIKLLFSDGIEKIVDFTSFLKAAKHVFIPLKEIEYFKNFQLDDITISWPNGADFEPELLYDMGEETKKIGKKPSQKSSQQRKVIKSKPVYALEKKLPKRK
jgi:Protein of unknown function (DUF2442)